MAPAVPWALLVHNPEEIGVLFSFDTQALSTIEKSLHRPHHGQSPHHFTNDGLSQPCHDHHPQPNNCNTPFGQQTDTPQPNSTVQPCRTYHY